MKACQIPRNATPPDLRTILVVGDEAEVLDLIHETVEGLEYQLIVTRDPKLALRALTNNQSIELLITDLFMPSMDGAALLDKCRQIRPGLRAVLTTGAASDQELRSWRTRGEIVVPKPWFNDELTLAVEKALMREPHRSIR
jgi:two-component system, NtrC family, response regulator GlrR